MSTEVARTVKIKYWASFGSDSAFVTVVILYNQLAAALPDFTLARMLNSPVMAKRISCIFKRNKSIPVNV